MTYDDYVPDPPWPVEREDYYVPDPPWSDERDDYVPDPPWDDTDSERESQDAQGETLREGI